MWERFELEVFELEVGWRLVMKEWDWESERIMRERERLE